MTDIPQAAIAAAANAMMREVYEPDEPKMPLGYARNLAKVALESAMPHIAFMAGADMGQALKDAAAAERERIRQLAIEIAERTLKNGFDTTALYAFADDLAHGRLGEPGRADDDHEL